MAATLKSWTHPATGTKRIYVSGVIGQGHGDKVWIEQQPADSFGCDWKICKKLSFGSGEARHIDERVESLVRNPGEKSPSFAEILVMCEK